MNHVKKIVSALHFFTIILLVPLSSPAMALDINHKIDGIDAEDIDVLIGEFGSLVKAFEKFAIGENSDLKKRIDQTFNKFDDSMKCTIDLMLVKGRNTIEGSLPEFEGFRSEESKKCNLLVLRPFGTGGSLDRAIYEGCILREFIVKKDVPMENVSSGYAGLKELANASYCQYKGNPDSEDFKRARGFFSESNILMSGYGDMSRIADCKRSTPEKLFQCTQEYQKEQRELLSNFMDVDLSHIDFNVWDSMASDLEGPISPPKYEFWKNAYISSDQLESYESVIAVSRRYVEVAKAKKKQRNDEYNKALKKVISKIVIAHNYLKNSNADSMVETYMECYKTGVYCYDYYWPKFDEYASSVLSYLEECAAVYSNEHYVEFVKRADKKDCEDRILQLEEMTVSWAAHFKLKEEEFTLNSRLEDRVRNTPGSM